MLKGCNNDAKANEEGQEVGRRLDWAIPGGEHWVPDGEGSLGMVVVKEEGARELLDSSRAWAMALSGGS